MTFCKASQLEEAEAEISTVFDMMMEGEKACSDGRLFSSSIVVDHAISNFQELVAAFEPLLATFRPP